jgi:hypothetical protein
MGLARTSALPMAVAGALFCAPLTAQTRPSDNNPNRLIEKLIGLAWLYNWYLAGPLYAEAEKLFEQARDRCVHRRPGGLIRFGLYETRAAHAVQRATLRSGDHRLVRPLVPAVPAQPRSARRDHG